MIKVGILGPVGSGKTTLIEVLASKFREKGHKVGIITNDVVSSFDATRMYDNLVTKGVIPKEALMGLVTGGCPHTAVREDPSVNLRAVESIVSAIHPDYIFIESGGDNVMSTFSPTLADYSIFILDTASGDKYPKKGGLGITESDLLVINKVDLAPLVGADVDKMQRDAASIRKAKPFVFVSLRNNEGISKLMEILGEDLGA